MLIKTLFVIFVATISTASAMEDDDLVNTVLDSGTNIISEVAKVATNEPDKRPVDLKALYKKYKIEEKANQARSYLQDQLTRGIESTHEYIKKSNFEEEDDFKDSIALIKGEDPVLWEKLTKFNEKNAELNRITEDIIKYVLDADKFIGYYDNIKTSLKPLERKVVEIVKNLEAGIIKAVNI